METKTRSLASLKRAKQKENKELKKDENKESLKPIKRDINIPEAIAIEVYDAYSNGEDLTGSQGIFSSNVKSGIWSTSS